jgi:hemerythrin
MKRPRVQQPKLPKGVPQEFIDGIQAMTTDQLKAQIVLLQVQNQENEEFKLSEGYLKAEEEFKHHRDRHNEVVGPVKEVSLSLKNKTKLVVERLKEKGGA